MTHERSVVVRARRAARARRTSMDLSRRRGRASHADGGEIVEVIGPRRRRIGDALFSDRSQISIRMLTAGRAARPTRR